ncbi:MAG TPA: class I SAM-dependent methyltransferase [Usitatibacter sp.]|nr:class I SAM-dependent methyltransferase [Usitatibacter sp.]
MDSITQQLEAHNAREKARAPGWYGEWMRVNCVIDPRDDIYRFFAAHPLACNPVREYLADGWRTLSELNLALDAAGRSLMASRSVLEFASGFGRFTRHLAAAMPGRVTVSDVQPGSVEFAIEQFGVKGFHSSTRPAEVPVPARYDLVFVLSMFTHLPLEAWTPWIRTLACLTAPGGVLLVSVHSEGQAKADGVELGPDGTRFIPSSESRHLGADVYGTTFTTRRYAEETFARALPGWRLHYRETAFWAGQDAVLLEAPRPWYAALLPRRLSL